MDSAKLNDWMQVFGIFAVVASLIFVGMQMQQDRRIAELATYQERAIASAQVSLDLFSNVIFLETRATAIYGGSTPMIEVDTWASPISANQATTSVSLMMAPFFMFDNSHFQYQEGFLPEEHWYRVREIIKAMLRSPFERWAATELLAMQRPAFRDELIQILDELDHEQRD